MWHNNNITAIANISYVSTINLIDFQLIKNKLRF